MISIIGAFVSSRQVASNPLSYFPPRIRVQPWLGVFFMVFENSSAFRHRVQDVNSGEHEAIYERTRASPAGFALDVQLADVRGRKTMCQSGWSCKGHAHVCERYCGDACGMKRKRGALVHLGVPPRSSGVRQTSWNAKKSGSKKERVAKSLCLTDQGSGLCVLDILRVNPAYGDETDPQQVFCDK